MEEIFRLRPVPLRYRCDRCQQTAAVVLNILYLCGDCYLEECEHRYGKTASSHRRASATDHATASST